VEGRGGLAEGKGKGRRKGEWRRRREVKGESWGNSALVVGRTDAPA